METKDKAKAPVLTGTDYGLTDHGYTIPDGYEFVGVRKDFCDREEIVLRKKTNVYPNTYTACCEVLVGRKPKDNEISFEQMCLYLVDENNSQNFDFNAPMLHEFNCLYRLVMCKYAYWKIAGEQLGLDKHWEPDWMDEKTKYTIKAYQNHIIKDKVLRSNCILVFPTEEMRDAFYENFKDLIDGCKELL